MRNKFKDIHFSYDAIKDWIPESKWILRGGCVIAISLVIMGYINIKLTDDIGIKVIAVFFNIGLGLYLLYLFAIRKGRPWIKSGVHVISVNEELLLWDMKLYAEPKEIKFAEVRKISILGNKIEFLLYDGNRHSIRINKIRNPDKRNEFVEVMQKVQIFLSG